MKKKHREMAVAAPAELPVADHLRFRFKLDEMMTVNEAARWRGVTRGAIWNLIRRRRLRVEMVFGRALVYRAEIEHFEPLIAVPPHNKT
ncbi:MAG: hypothetical protein U0Z53_25935 [Blastocatellia bacterium]